MTTMDRRTVLRLGVGASVVALAGGLAGYELTRPGDAPAPLRAASPDRRRLVVLEMAGGSDGLSMVVPYTDGRYRDLRPATAIDAAQVHRIDGLLGFHPSLETLALQGASVVAGVGIAKPDLSHFEMLHRWQAGDPDGTVHPATGFLGRLCDTLGDPSAPAVGVSLGLGATQSLACERVTTISIDTGSEGVFPAFGADDGVQDAWVAAQRAMAHPDRADSALLTTARAGGATALRFSDVAATLPEAADGYPETDFGAQLRLAARLLADDQIGLRVVHVPMDADFDTHTDHRIRYARLMADFDKALAALRTDLARRGIADRVLIATYSEFGRRVPDNGSTGLDHGAAGTALLMGPTDGGVFGEQPSLRHLDPDDNLKATVNMTEYYATIAESWFGIPAGDVLPGSPKPIPGIL
jgi:uncharacterized protein (DUF1501 family)